MATGWRPVFRIPSRKELAIRWNQYRTDMSLWMEKRGYRQNGGGCRRPRAAFVVGSQRSGTDMVTWTLDKSLDVHRFDETSRSAFVDCRIRPAAIRERLVASSRAKRVIFKPVCDSYRVSQLLSDHADARAVWVYRDFRDVANSAVQRWANNNLRWVQEVAAGGGDWGRMQWNRELITPQRQEQIRGWCKTDLNPHGAAAVFWYLVNSTFFSQSLENDSRVTLARYEDLVAAPAVEFKRLCEFLEIAYRDEMVAGIFQSSVKRRSKSPISVEVAQACEELQSRLDGVNQAVARS